MWSLLDLHPQKQIFLSDSLGFEDSKEFITKDDKKIINSILYGINKLNKKDKNYQYNKSNFVKFSVDSYFLFGRDYDSEISIYESFEERGTNMDNMFSKLQCLRFISPGAWWQAITFSS